MNLPTKAFIAVAAFVMLAGSAFADKQDELSSQRDESWSILDLPEFTNPRAEVNETEPVNNTCPGEPYALSDIYHGALSSGDEDWITFQCNQGELITIGTDADGALPTVNTTLILVENDCTTELAFDDNTGPGLYSLISNFPAPYTGSYHVRVLGNPLENGNYFLIATSRPPTDTLCPIDSYKSYQYDQTIPIPDFPNPIFSYGPLVIEDDNFLVRDIIVGLGISHTYVGDLYISIHHIPLVGQQADVNLIYRPIGGVGNCFGDLIGSANDKYYFGIGFNLEVLGETSCPAQIPLNCYDTPIERGLLASFQDRPKAGQWFLTILDNAGGDVGTLYNFSLHFLNEEPVSVDALSWGRIKANYR